MIRFGDPKTSFSKFLKYGENKENHIFTIDNTNGFKGGAFFFPDSAQMLTFAQTNLHSRVLKIF